MRDEISAAVHHSNIHRLPDLSRLCLRRRDHAPGIR
jgi:hypothetical protein